MAEPASLFIDLQKIERNARALVERLPEIQVVGLTTITGGDVHVGKAMVSGGVAALADARLASLANLRWASLGVPLWLVRPPRPDEAVSTVQIADVSFNSEWETIQALDCYSEKLGRTHCIFVLVDLGGLAGGVSPEHVGDLASSVSALDHVLLVGLAANLPRVEVPPADKLEELVDLARDAQEVLSQPLVVSLGDLVLANLAVSHSLPLGINNVRLGEAILLATDPLSGRPLLPELELDVFTLRAPVIECQRKPLPPAGFADQDYYGAKPGFAVSADLDPAGFPSGPRRWRAICEIGRQDVVPEDLTPLDPEIRVRGGSSDHLILDVDGLEVVPRPGDSVDFHLNYLSLLQVFTSPYVEKAYVPDA